MDQREINNIQAGISIIQYELGIGISLGRTLLEYLYLKEENQKIKQFLKASIEHFSKYVINEFQGVVYDNPGPKLKDYEN